MPVKDESLHGSVPESSPVVLLVIDVINDLEFEGGEALLKEALPVAQHILKLKERTTKAGIPSVYVNDNFGKWKSDFKQLVRHCLEDGVRGKPIVEMLQPEESDYFVLKPKHSGFFSTTLELLLKHFRAKTLILTGVAGNMCILFTANDAYMRDYQLVVPQDCVASENPEDNRQALTMMQGLLKARIDPSNALDLNALKKEAGEP